MEPFEPPKYIASLIAAINDGAKWAQLGALTLTAIGVFLLANSFTATDEDLLLSHAISISQLGGVRVPVTFAYGLAPPIFVAVHLYTMIRYDMVAENLRRFNVELATVVPLAADRERCLQLLANVEFINALAMPRGSLSASWLFRATVLALLAVFPALVLVLVQIGSLRLQNEMVSGVQKASVASDLVLLIWYFFRRDPQRTLGLVRLPLRRKVRLFWLPAVLAVMEWAWLNVPSPNASGTVGWNLLRYADYHSDPAHGTLLARWARVALALPVQPIDLILCPAVESGWGCRFLVTAQVGGR